MQTHTQARSQQEPCLRAKLVMHADVYGPSRCLAQFASLGVLPQRFEARRTCDDKVVVDFEFDAAEDRQMLTRALQKLSVMPVMCAEQDASVIELN